MRGVMGKAVFPVKPAIRPLKGTDYVLAEDFYFPATVGGWDVTAHVAPGFRTDGASIPRLLWRVLGSPYDPDVIAAAIAHDALYRGEIVPRKDADAAFLALMEACGVAERKRRWLLRGVRWFGWITWARHTPESVATDEGARADGGAYRYMDAGGELQEVQEEEALKFIAAYMAGIKTFRRYYPVVEKTSLWRNPPGLNRSGRSFTGGSLPFSAGLGTFADPPVSLNGYPSGNWYKSRDSWEEGADRTWTRTEQWTYTPDGAASDHAWIYGGGGAE